MLKAGEPQFNSCIVAAGVLVEQKAEVKH